MIIFLRVCGYLANVPKLLKKVQYTVENIKITIVISTAYPLPLLPTKGINIIYWQINSKAWNSMAMLGKCEIRKKKKCIAFVPSDQWLNSRPWEVFRSACIWFKQLLFICHKSTWNATGENNLFTSRNKR